MIKKILLAVLLTFAVLILYLLAGPAPIDPVVFEPPPPAPALKTDDTLKKLEVLDLDGRTGPEDVIVSSTGEIFAAVLSGDILRLAPDGSSVETFVNTGGRPLGLAFDNTGRLIVADPFRGLLRVNADASMEVLVPASPPSTAKPKDFLCYANNVDVAADGTIYFTDSSARHCPPAYGDTFEASLYDIFEHRKTGRLLAYDPVSKQTRVLVDGIQFANGVALSPDGRYVLIVETGDSRVLRYHLRGERRGSVEAIVEGMAGFPDNLNRGRDGRYWIGFTKPRSKILEKLAGNPFARKMIMRLPRSLFPVPPPFGHIVAIDVDGNVLARYQDAEPEYPDTTGATETADGLFVHSLHARGLGWLARSEWQR